MSASSPAAPATWRLPKRIAYVVNHSFPYSSDGYAVRTHEVARALTGLGHDVMVINRPGRPWDIEGFPATAEVPNQQTIDGVRYLFLPCAAGPEMNRRARLRQAEKILLETFEVFRPGAVLAVSNWENAEPAQYAARRWGVPFFYEQRGFWEMSQAAREPGYEKTKEYERDRQNELRIAQAAQAVFTLNGAMRDELVRRGVSKDKIHLVPNGVSQPGPLPRDVTRASIGCRAKYLLGYVGSLSEYEGSGDLLELMSELRNDRVDVDLLIVGSSAPKGLIGSHHVTPTEDRLQQEARKRGLGEHVHFISQVPQNRIGGYYSLLDAVIMPRRKTLVTELVAPLKPYAAAAYGVPVFMTDMSPLDEVARDIYASLFPEGDMKALAAMLRQTLERGGHPAVLNALKPDLYWPQRVQPMSKLLKAAADAQPDPMAVLAPAAPAPAPQAAAAAPAPVAQVVPAPQPTPPAEQRFNAHILPRVALGATAGEPVFGIGPCASLGSGARLTRLTRVNLLSELATAETGRFVIDWAGLQTAAGSADAAEWHGMWSIDNMRLNRQIMDACRIALDRGLKLQVLGPVMRSKAPLFRTVAGVLDELQPGQQAALQEAAE